MNFSLKLFNNVFDLQIKTNYIKMETEGKRYGEINSLRELNQVIYRKIPCVILIYNKTSEKYIETLEELAGEFDSFAFYAANSFYDAENWWRYVHRRPYPNWMVFKDGKLVYQINGQPDIEKFRLNLKTASGMETSFHKKLKSLQELTKELELTLPPMVENSNTVKEVLLSLRREQVDIQKEIDKLLK